MTKREGTCMELYTELRYEPSKARQKYFEGCPQKFAKLLFDLRENVKVFPEHKLDTIILEELMKPGTALVTTKAHLPTIWPAFERAMKQNRTVMFKNNYELFNDESLPAKMDRMVVLSGMNLSFTQIVNRDAQSLISSGIWDFWRVLEKRTVGKSENAWAGKRFDNEFRPLAMGHEGLYTPIVTFVTLLGAI